MQESTRAECTYVTLSAQAETPGGNQFRGSGIEDGREKLVLPRFAREGREGKRARRRRRRTVQAKVGEPGGGAGHGGGSNHPYTRRYETTSVPLRRSDFRPIKSPRWRGGGGGKGAPREASESPRRTLSNFTRNSVNFGAPALCSSRDQPRFIIARARWSPSFFSTAQVSSSPCPPASPSFVVPLSFRTGGPRLRSFREPRTSPRAAKGSSALDVAVAVHGAVDGGWSIERSAALHTQVSSAPFAVPRFMRINAPAKVL